MLELQFCDKNYKMSAIVHGFNTHVNTKISNLITSEILYN